MTAVDPVRESGRVANFDDALRSFCDAIRPNPATAGIFGGFCDGSVKMDHVAFF